MQSPIKYGHANLILEMMHEHELDFLGEVVTQFDEDSLFYIEPQIQICKKS